MPAPVPPRSLQSIWWWLVWGVMTAGCIAVEIARASGDPETMHPVWRACLDFAFDTPMFLPLCLMFPFAWWIRTGFIFYGSDLLRRCIALCANAFQGMAFRVPATPVSIKTVARDWLLALAVGGLSLLMSWEVGLAFGDLPPAYHDEYSYLFQAKTLSAGHFSYPSHATDAELFDQMHVVNLGRFASRYYPGTGAWLMPWLALGHVVWAQWLAGALTAMLMYWTGKQLGGVGVGLLSGIFTALSPGLVLFSNLLLAHHPTLFGLSLFLGCFVHWMNARRGIWLLPAGIGLAFAMLCRPATAAAFGLPFGAWFVMWLLDSRNFALSIRLRGMLYLGLPLVAGWGVMIAYNSAITGHWRQSPYQLYTDHYTPRHVYGFDNVPRGTTRQRDRVLPVVTRNYDAWAENLTPQLAIRNTGNRLVASWRWTLGIVPILWVCLASAGMWRGQHPAWLLIAIAIASLHLMHIPYWFDGIMHWHYVFESSLCWILLVGGGTGLLVNAWQAADRPWLTIWLGSLLTVAVVTNYVDGQPYWIPRLSMGIVEVRYPRRIYGQFQQQLQENVTELPALVLVVPDPADRHMDFVTNEPDQSAPILIGRFVATGESQSGRLRQIAQEFPNRALYLFDAKTRQLTRVEP